jgi:hypothetical protein
LDSVRARRFPTFAGTVASNRLCVRFDRGGGNELNAVLGDHDGFIQGFDHESPLSPYADDATWPGLFRGFPAALIDPLAGLPAEERFPTPDLEIEVLPTTFCVWWNDARRTWTHGSIEFPEMGPLDDDGASFLIRGLVPDHFIEEFGWDESLVRQVFETGECDEAVAARLNPATDWSRLQQEIRALHRQAR